MLHDDLGTWAGRLPAVLVGEVGGSEARHALLREMAARALGRPADEVEIRHERGRPPRLIRPRSGLRLSSASRGTLAALAVAERAVGVDVEAVGAAEAIPWNVLAPAEADALRRSPVPERDFARLWAVKEAYLKALGLGLSREPSSFAVRLEPDDEASPPAANTSPRGGESRAAAPGEGVATGPEGARPPRPPPASSPGQALSPPGRGFLLERRPGRIDDPQAKREAHIFTAWRGEAALALVCLGS